MDQTPADSGLPIALLTAVAVERKAIIRRLGGGEQIGPMLWRGRWEGCNWLLTQTGMGPPAARRATEALLTGRPVAAVLCVGLAGGLAPDAAVAEVLAAERVAFAEDGSTVHAADPDLLAHARAAGAGVGALVTSARLAGSAVDKAELRVRTGFDMVDMESAAAAQVAAGRNVPFLAVRAISDGPGDELPAGLAGLLDESGSPRCGRLTLALLRRPTLAVELWRLGARSRAALSRLGDVLAETLRRPDLRR